MRSCPSTISACATATRDALDDRRALRQRVGVQLQASELPDKLRVGEALELFASLL